jgi:peptidoglycan L-alanyl-D-glutamate endopeptidase CwlK
VAQVEKGIAMRVLKLGSSGEDVRILQAKLAQRGFPPGSVDGNFGPGTQAALIAFQRSESLLPDGVFGSRTAAALGFDSLPEMPSAIPGVTVEVVCQMFPVTPRRNIETHLPNVLEALLAPKLDDRRMVLMALATVRAESEGFLPISEAVSSFNTSPGGRLFDLYDNRRDLGNQGPPDGERFRGRGFIQLTGRANYLEHGHRIGLGDRLVEEPDRANEPQIAAALLASFLKRKEGAIKRALLEGDLRGARRLVNGGSHGLDRFTDAYRIGEHLLVDRSAAATA